MPSRWSRIAPVLAIAISSSAQPTRWQQLSNSAKQLSEAGKYTEALPVAREALQVAEKSFAPGSAPVAASIASLRSISFILGHYAEAEPLARRELDADQRIAGPESPNVAVDLMHLGEILLGLEKSTEAESLFAQALAIDSKLHGAQHPSVAQDLLLAGQAYLEHDKVVDAERVFRRAIAIDSIASGKESAAVARESGYLSEALRMQDRLQEAMTLVQAYLRILVKAVGGEHPDVALFINQMGAVYQAEGRPWDAAKAYEVAAMMDEKVLGPAHPTAAMFRANLATALAEEGDYERAQAEFNKAIDATTKSLGPDHPQRARQIEQFAVMQMHRGNAVQACPVLEGVTTSLAKSLGRDHPDFAAANGQLADCFRLVGDFTGAMKRLNESIAVDTKAFGPNHPVVAEDNVLIGGVAKDAGQFQIAERYYLHALQIDNKALGPLHPKTQAIVLKTALNYYIWKKPDQAEPLFERAVLSLLNDLRVRSSYMSEGDRLRFLKTAPDVFPSYFNFAYTYPDRAHLVAKIYNVLLLERGFAASSAGAVRARILAGGDQELIARLDALTEKKRELSALQTSPEGDPAAFREKVSAMQNEVNRLEEGLAFYSPVFANKAGLTDVTWPDIQKTLQPGDAAIEFVRFAIPAGAAIQPRISASESTRPPDKGYYAALVLTKDQAEPKLVPLGDAFTAEQTIVNAYQAQQASVRGISTAKTLALSDLGTKDAYHAFWKPIEPLLTGAKRLYIAADGILNQFPIALLSDEEGKLLFEKYDLRLLNSTKDLVEPVVVSTAKTAVVMGNPSFDLSEAQQRSALARLNVNGTHNIIPLSRATPAKSEDALPIPAASTRAANLNVISGKLAPLPATQAEVDAVSSQLKSSNWQVQSFTADLALEEALMAQKGPRLLHIATHGYFLPNKPIVKVTEKGVKQLIQIDDPMLRSGLFFAGADRAESGAPQPEGLEDGILTSFEATQLNLQGTELVVLSACDTGRGDQQNGEGVFGLRRALQEAGAQAVLMSSWSVPDKETQELMSLFYKKWLAGADKHEALRQAQLEERAVVKQRYGKDLPFYWGAFVLVGR